MATIHDFQLFENACAGCGKRIKSYSLDRQGALPQVTCNRACETKAARRNVFQKNITYKWVSKLG